MLKQLLARLFEILYYIAAAHVVVSDFTLDRLLFTLQTKQYSLAMSA